MRPLLLLLLALQVAGCGMIEVMEVPEFAVGEQLTQPQITQRLVAAGYDGDVFRRHYCDGREVGVCDAACSHCQLKLFGYAGNTITLEAAGELFTVSSVEPDRNPRYAYLAQRRNNVNYNQRMHNIPDAVIDDAILHSRLVEGMTLQDAAAAHPNSRFTQTYWCNNKKYADCPRNCNCLDVVYEENYTGVQGNTLFMGYSTPTSIDSRFGEQTGQIIVRIYPAIHQHPYLIFP